MCVLTLTTGTMFVMWLGEQITERGIGNGMSLLIFAGIVVNFPTAVLGTLDQMQTGQIGPLRIIFLIAMAVVVIGAIIFVERAHPAGSRCSTPNVWSAAGNTAARARTSR